MAPPNPEMIANFNRAVCLEGMEYFEMMAKRWIVRDPPWVVVNLERGGDVIEIISTRLIAFRINGA